MSYKNEFNYGDCPWCKTKNVAFINVLEAASFADSSGNHREWSWLRCPRCAGAISTETKRNVFEILQQVPNSQNDITVDYLPDDVSRYYSNAITAMSAGIPSSAAVELRRTLEAAARHQGVEERTLVKAVEKLVEKGLVTKSFGTVLSHVRKIGNQGAHATDEQLSEEEVGFALKFTTQILRNLFEVPETLRAITPEIEES